jgi:hypothetical protein
METQSTTSARPVKLGFAKTRRAGRSVVADQQPAATRPPEIASPVRMA